MDRRSVFPYAYDDGYAEFNGHAKPDGDKYPDTDPDSDKYADPNGNLDALRNFLPVILDGGSPAGW